MLDTLTYMRMYETKFNNGLIGRIPQPKPPERRLSWEVYEDCQERLCYLSISAKIDQKVLKKSIETAKERFKQPEKPRRIAAPKPKKTRRILPPVVRKDFICLRCGFTDPSGGKGRWWYCAKCRQAKLDKEYHRTSLFQEAQKRNYRAAMCEAYAATADHPLDDAGNSHLVESYDPGWRQDRYSLRSATHIDFCVIFRRNKSGDRVAYVPDPKYREWFLKQSEKFRLYNGTQDIKGDSGKLMERGAGPAPI